MVLTKARLRPSRSARGRRTGHPPRRLSEPLSPGWPPRRPREHESASHRMLGTLLRAARPSRPAPPAPSTKRVQQDRLPAPVSPVRAEARRNSQSRLSTSEPTSRMVRLCEIGQELWKSGIAGDATRGGRGPSPPPSTTGRRSEATENRADDRVSQSHAPQIRRQVRDLLVTGLVSRYHSLHG